MSDEQNNNGNNNSISPSFDQSSLLLKQRQVSKDALLSGKTEVEAIKDFINKSDIAIEQLQFEKAQEKQQAQDYKKLWTEAHGHITELKTQNNWFEDQLKAERTNKLNGTTADYATLQKDYEQQQSTENLKQKFSNHFLDSIKNNKW